jgi:RNA polymerase sigma factor (sigma-70 family)
MSSLAYGLALRVVGNADLAEDVVQDAFMRIWHRADRYDPARGAARPWVLRVVRNVAIDRIRSGDARGARRDEEPRGRRARADTGAARRGRIALGALAVAPPGAGRATARAAACARDRLLRRPVAQRDRGARTNAAGHGEDAHSRRRATTT